MSDLSSLIKSGLIERGTPAFRRTNLALFAAGFSTFSLMYCVQPILPLFSQTFHVSAAESSLAISCVTGAIACAILIAGAVSEACGRKSVMAVSLFSSAALTIISPVVPHWHAFLVIRALEGLAFSGLPAVAMAYLSEEIHPQSVGLAMGLYVGGTAVGGMSGRFLVGVLTDLYSWRVAMVGVGITGLLAAVVFWRSLPDSVHFQARPMHARDLLRTYRLHLSDFGLRLLFLEGCLVMGAFVGVYNYIGYRLTAPPYSLSKSAVGSIFVVYLVGMFSSAWVGELAGRLGRRNVLWAIILVMLGGLLLTLPQPLYFVVAGLILFTFGFFGAHSILSSWVGLRAQHSRAQAASLYLFFYYLGSSVAGTAAGVFWKTHAWPGVIGFLTLLLLVALIAAVRLIRVQPRQSLQPVSS